MKKFLAMLLVAAMVFSMAACAKAPEAAQPAATEETAGETAGETAETAEAPKDGKVYKVAMICDSSISDGGWGACPATTP